MIGVNSGEDSLLNYGGGLERFGKLIKPFGDWFEVGITL